MPNRLTRLQVKNFRSLEDVNIELGAVNVLFGPNGAGKSSLLDTIWFVRDCAVRGVNEASSFRNHGIGALWDGADEGAHAFQKALRQPIPAFGMSDGQLQMLIHLTALFSQGRGHQSLILFDEPETSLHPYALTVFAEAVELATTRSAWNKQVLIASHSPVLISQFELENVFAVELGSAGQTIITRVSDMTEIQDLLEEYATGSLYMAEMIAAQSQPLLLDEKYQLRGGILSEVTRGQLDGL